MNQELSLDTIVDCLTKARNIEQLELLSNYKIDFESFMKIADLKTLKCLKLSVDYRCEIPPEFISKIADHGCKLETIELKNYSTNDPHKMEEAFDKFFENRSNTLRNFIILLDKYEKPTNILKNMTLCQNLEEFSATCHKCVIKQLPNISEMLIIKRLMFARVNMPKTFHDITDLLKKGRFPLLERLCIQTVNEKYGENLEGIKFKTGEFLESLLKNSPFLKSIHFLGYNVWDVSNEFLFKIIKNTNIYINFGKVTIDYDCKVGLILSDKYKRNARQLSMEQYLLDHDISVFDKYQKMKADFSIWFEEKSNWKSFGCMKALHD